VRPEQAGCERLGGAAQLRPGQLHRPGGGLDGHVPVPVPGTWAGIVAGRGPLVPVAAEELGDLGFEGGLHQQLRAEPGDVFQDLRELLILGEQLIDVAADTVSRGYSVWHGRRSFPSMTWRSLKGTYARLVIYTRIRTSPMTLPSGARTRNRRTPHGSVAIGFTISKPSFCASS